jgi:hypothetical protein
MRRLYRNIWIPFTATKKRFVLLAIISYLTMC